MKEALTLVDKLYMQIKEDIVRCVFQPGEKIIFRELATRYSASETPLKQALNRLVTEGLVTNIPRKGMWIRKITAEEIIETMDIRLMIELYNIESMILALNNDITLRKKLKDNIAQNRERSRNFLNIAEYLEVYHLDHQFHKLLVYSTGNKKLLSLYDGLHSHTYASYIYGKQPKEKVILGIEEHELVYEALKEGDKHKAEQAIRTHHENARDIITLMLKLERH